MPVAARVISNPFEYVPHGSYTQGKNGGIVLQSVNIASMVGSIHQIAYLADYATEIFDNLQKTTASFHDRICDITARTKTLNSQIPEIHRAVLEKNVSTTLVSVFKQGEVSPETQMLTPTTRPRQISLRYELMNKIPAVEKMDQYLSPQDLEIKGKCANLYSNPLFFFNEWVRVENARQQLLQEDKEKKKREKQERKALLKKEKEKRNTQIKPEKKKGLNWRDRYLNVNTTGTETKKSPVVIDIEEDEPPRSLPNRRPMLNDLFEKATENDDDDKPDEQDNDDIDARPSVPAFSPPPPPPSFVPNVPDLPPPPLMPPLPPPPPTPPSVYSDNPSIPPPPLPPVPPPPSRDSLPRPSPSSSDSYFSTPSSPADLDALPPPPPRRPNPFGQDGERGNLLASITQGKKLRPVDDPDKVDENSQDNGGVPKFAPKPKGNNFLDQIKRGSVLKKVDVQAVAQKKDDKAVGLFAGDAVASILARRKNIEVSDSDSDESDGDW